VLQWQYSLYLCLLDASAAKAKRDSDQLPISGKRMTTHHCIRATVRLVDRSCTTGNANLAMFSEARWRSGYAEDCKSLHAGSIPARASKLNVAKREI
jgi:hypothetical protein